MLLISVFSGVDCFAGLVLSGVCLGAWFSFVRCFSVFVLGFLVMVLVGLFCGGLCCMLV